MQTSVSFNQHITYHTTSACAKPVPAPLAPLPCPPREQAADPNFVVVWPAERLSQHMPVKVAPDLSAQLASPMPGKLHSIAVKGGFASLRWASAICIQFQGPITLGFCDPHTSCRPFDIHTSCRPLDAGLL